MFERNMAINHPRILCSETCRNGLAHAEFGSRIRHILLAGVTALTTALCSGLAFAGHVVIPRSEATRLAAQKGWPVRAENPDGRIVELQRIVNGIPLYYITTNLDAAKSVRANECWPGGSSGLGLNGSGVTLGIWDGGAVRTTHRELTGRAVQRDVPSSVSGHSTHVAGTMIGAGLYVYNPRYPQWAAGQSKGMSYAATLDCYDWDSDTQEMAKAAEAGLRVSNHSYGFVAGWNYDWGTNAWYWYGDVTISETEDYYFGFYDDTAAEWDQVAYGHPSYLFVVSAGNDRDEGPSPGQGHYYLDPQTQQWAWSTTTRSVDGRNGYDCISHASLAKNGLIVGAVYDVSGGYSGPSSVVMSEFSCWGPTDDGRIKPDVIGNGTDLFSSYSNSDSYYASLSGTSMASPNVAGSLGLLIQEYRNSHPGKPDMRAATLKGLVIHTADECGTANGPDYRFGWGLLNVHRAADVIAADAAQPQVISELGLANGKTFEMTLTTSGGQELRATICWTDPAGTPVAPALNPPDRMLVNDLDLRIQQTPSGSTYFPWVLNPADPAAAATTGDNDRDNVEQIVIPAAAAGTYTLRVSHKGTLSGGGQNFSLLITGAATLLIDCNGNGVADYQDVASGASSDCNQNDVPDSCELPPAGFAADCNDDHILDECQLAAMDCNGNGIVDSCDIAAGTSEDCNANGIPDECELTRVIVQNPDQTNGYASDADPMSSSSSAYSMAENFKVTDTRTMVAFTIWGLYGPDNGDAITDNFTVRVLEDAGGLPGGVYTEDSPATFTRAKTGKKLFGCNEWLFTFSLNNPVTLTPGSYFIEVFNNTAGNAATFYWETAPLDPTHGIAGAAWASETPGVNWKYDSTIELALRITVASAGVDCNGDGIIDACQPPVLTVNVGPDRDLAPDRVHPSIAESVTITGGVSPFTYLWEVVSGPALNGLGDPTAENPSFTPPAPGTYTLRCTITDTSLGPCSASDELVVHVQPLSTSVVTGVLACVGVYTNPLGGDPTASGGTPPYDYSWVVLSGPSDFDDASKISSNPAIKPPVMTDYNVRVTVSDSSDPPFTATSDVIHISVGDKPTVSAGLVETYHPIIVIGQTLQLGGDPTARGGHAPYSYGWSIPLNPDDAGSFNDPTASNPTFAATAKGAYIIRAQITDAAGCSADTQFTVSVVADPPYSEVPIGSTNPTAFSLCGSSGIAPASALIVGLGFIYAGRRRWLRRR